MAYTTPRSWVAGEVLTAAQLNQDVRDNVAFLANPPACRAYHSTTQGLANLTEASLTLDSEDYDNDNMHVGGAPTRITFNTAGLYIVEGGNLIAPGGDYIYHRVRLRVDGTTYIPGASQFAAPNGAGNTDALFVSVAAVRRFTVGQYVELRGEQRNVAGTSRNASDTALSATWLGL